MISDQARKRAEKHFKKEERAQDGRQAMVEYKAHALAVREKTVRLKALRLAEGASHERIAEIGSQANEHHASPALKRRRSATSFRPAETTHIR